MVRRARASSRDDDRPRSRGPRRRSRRRSRGSGSCSLIAVLFIYVVLGILYESFIHPLTILSALPFAGFGALLTLLVFRKDLSVYRLRRRDPARRARQEERDHDGGLRRSRRSATEGKDAVPTRSTTPASCASARS